MTDSMSTDRKTDDDPQNIIPLIREFKEAVRESVRRGKSPDQAIDDLLFVLRGVL